MGRPPLDIGTYGKITCYEQGGRQMARAKFRDYDGRTRTVARFGDTKSAAERALKKALADRQAPGGVGVTPDTKLAVLADMWLEEVRASDRAAGTKETYGYVIDHTIKRAFGGIRLREVRVAALDRAITQIRDHQGPGVAKTTKSCLSGMFKLAIRHEAIEINPVRDTSDIPRSKKAIRALTVEEVERLTDGMRALPRAAQLDLADLVEFMLMTGVRIGEACATRAAVLDKKHGTFEVNATVIRLKGEGLQIQQRTKTEAGWRVLALPPTAVDMLERRSKELRLAGPAGVVFASPQARALRDPRNTTGDLREVLDLLGFEWVTSHVFRKTVATRLDEAGLTARQIADQLGHSKPSMTQDVYMGRNVVTAEAAKILDR